MSFDETIAGRVRGALAGRDDVTEKRMFGGLAFMVGGHMCCGVLGSDLMVRVGPVGYAVALLEPHAREMDFTGRALKGLVYVGKGGIVSDRSLRRWLDRGLEYVLSLPKKPSRPKGKRRA